MKNNFGSVDLLISTHSEEMHGGAEVALFSMVKHLQKDFRIHIASPYSGGLSKKLKDLPNVTVSYIEQPWWVKGSSDRSEFKITGSDTTKNPLVNMVELVNRVKPKICLTNTIATPWLSYASAITNTPHIWFIHELGLDFNYLISREESIKAIDLLSNKVFCNSLYTANHFRSFMSSNHDIGIVYPVSENKIPQKGVDSPFTNAYGRFVIVGSIVRQKNQLDAVKAIKELRDRSIDAELVVIGSPTDSLYYSEIIDYCKEYELGRNIKFLGVKENPSSYVKHADVVLMCSEAEAFGLATIEGMRLGKPIIGADDGGTSEIIKHNKNGLLYRLGDVNHLSNAMSTLILDISLSKKLGRNAKRDVESRFAPEKTYRNFISYLDSHINDLGSPLDLSPLRNTVTEYNDIIEQIREQTSLAKEHARTIEVIKSGRAWKIIRKISAFAHLSRE